MHSISGFRARLATVLSLRPLYFSVEPSRSAGESDGLQIKGIAQNSCRARFDAHSKRGTEVSNPPRSSGEASQQSAAMRHSPTGQFCGSMSSRPLCVAIVGSISSARIVISRMQHCAVPTARPGAISACRPVLPKGPDLRSGYQSNSGLLPGTVTPQIPTRCRASPEGGRAL